MCINHKLQRNGYPFFGVNSCISNDSSVHKEKFYIIVSGLFLFLFFLILYLFLSIQTGKSGIYTAQINFLETDSHRVMNDIVNFSANHYRTKVHPIFVLILNPLGTLLSSVLGSQVKAALLINSFFCAAAVTASYFFFQLICKNTLNAIFFAGLFGVTANQIIFSAFPETSILAACSLIFTYSLFYWSLQKKEIRQSLWILAGVFSLGITVTNIFQTSICYMVVLCSIYDVKKNWRILFKFSNFAGSTLLITCVLALIQKLIYSSSILFFSLTAFSEEVLYMSARIFKEPFTVINELLKNLFLINILAPEPNILRTQTANQIAITFQGSWNYSTIEWLGVVIWVFLLLVNLYLILKSRTDRAFYIGIGFCLLFNFVLHSFYGVTENQIEYFIYSGNFTFLTFCLLTKIAHSKRFFTRCIISAEIFILAFTNISLITNIPNMVF